jgi:hypothetical protein
MPAGATRFFREPERFDPERLRDLLSRGIGVELMLDGKYRWYMLTPVLCAFRSGPDGGGTSTLVTADYMGTGLGDAESDWKPMVLGMRQGWWLDDREEHDKRVGKLIRFARANRNNIRMRSTERISESEDDERFDPMRIADFLTNNVGSRVTLKFNGRPWYTLTSIRRGDPPSTHIDITANYVHGTDTPTLPKEPASSICWYYGPETIGWYIDNTPRRSPDPRWNGLTTGPDKLHIPMMQRAFAAFARSKSANLRMTMEEAPVRPMNESKDQRLDADAIREAILAEKEVVILMDGRPWLMIFPMFRWDGRIAAEMQLIDRDASMPRYSGTWDLQQRDPNNPKDVSANHARIVAKINDLARGEGKNVRMRIQEPHRQVRTDESGPQRYDPAALRKFLEENPGGKAHLLLDGHPWLLLSARKVQTGIRVLAIAADGAETAGPNRVPLPNASWYVASSNFKAGTHDKIMAHFMELARRAGGSLRMVLEPNTYVDLPTRRRALRQQNESAEPARRYDPESFRDLLLSLPEGGSATIMAGRAPWYTFVVTKSTPYECHAVWMPHHFDYAQSRDLPHALRHATRSLTLRSHGASWHAEQSIKAFKMISNAARGRLLRLSVRLGDDSKKRMNEASRYVYKRLTGKDIVRMLSRDRSGERARLVLVGAHRPHVKFEVEVINQMGARHYKVVPAFGENRHVHLYAVGSGDEMCAIHLDSLMQAIQASGRRNSLNARWMVPRDWS